MTRARNTADTQTASGGPVSPSIAGKNAIINGGMDIWQRGTSFAFNNESKYTADRMYPTIVNTGATVSRQTTSDTTNLPFIQYCMRLQRNNATTNTGSIALTSSLENVDSQRFIGQTVTLSFYARRGSNYSSSSNVLTYYLVSGTGTDQNQATGFTGQATPIASTATLTTTWQRFSATATVSASATQLAFNCFYSPTGTAGANDYFEITGVQLELGSSATPFSRAGGTIQGELAACQRYYEAITGITYAGAGGYSYTYGQFVVYKATKRSTPTITVTRTAQNNFNNTAQASDIGVDGFVAKITSSNASNVEGYWIMNATVNSEL